MDTKYYSSKQESTISNYLGWTPICGSGAVACKPGDIQSDSWLGECKTHTERKDKIVFYQSHWSKIRSEAYSKFKKPVLFVDNGTQNENYTWCIIPKQAMVYGKEIPFMFSVKTNISFDYKDLITKTLMYGDLDSVWFSIDNFVCDVALMHISSFKKWFGEL